MHTRPSRESPLVVVAILLLSLSLPASAAEPYSFVAQWGSAGSAPGQFNYPYGLAVDKSCHLYVADAGNNRIQEFSSTGALLAYWGSAGVGAGQFNWPQGIAVDAPGDVYVADVMNHRIEKFSSSGTCLTQWGQHGRADGYFDYPTGVAADPLGYVYTAESCQDSCTLRIQRFTNTGAFVSKWPGQSAPSDVAADEVGNIFVIDENSVVKYSIYGTKLGQWGSYGTTPGKFDLPAGLCVDDNGNVYVADTGNHRIQKFTGTGTFVTQWGSYGTGPGQFRYPADVAVDDSGSVYVSDQLNQRIQKFRIRRVLLVHGICGQASDWDSFAQVLSDSGFVVDRLQYGNSDYSLRPAAYVRALAAKLDSMGPGPIAVVAHSMGGLVTREYMRRQVASGRPNKATQLVTLGTPHHGSDLLAKFLRWGPVADGFLGPLFGPCLSSQYSRSALLDMVPGAWYLNRLNYGLEASISDSTTGHGWSTHQPETGLPGDVYIASIAGTGSFCFHALRVRLWSEDKVRHPNDCTVATGSSLLTNTDTFRAADTLLTLEKPATHTENGLTTPCGEAYYSSATLAMRVATILRTSPAAPPLSVASEQPSSVAEATSATVEDSLQMAPAVVDSVPAGQIIERTVEVPATSLVCFTLLSTDAHLSLFDPNGTSVTVADTSAAAGITFFTTSDPGFEGFEIVGPVPGTWTLHINAAASTAGQRVVGIAEYASASAVQLSVLSTPLHSGDVMSVRGQLSSGGVLKTDVAWTCDILRPDGVTTPLTLYDDGAHTDSLAGDGIYGNTVTPAGGIGLYALTAAAGAESIGPLVAVAYCELADAQDLAIGTSDIYLSRNVPEATDSLTIYATVHNNSSTAALGVAVNVSDLRTGTTLGTSTVDLAAWSAATVQAPWVPATPDSHEIQVQVSPYVLDESDYSNNTASRVIVLGAPVCVEPGLTATQLRFDPPHPNPASHGVTFSFDVPRASAGSLVVYDILGRRVQGWRWAVLQPGNHSVEWDGRGVFGRRLGPGVYLCRLQVGDERLLRKIILLH